MSSSNNFPISLLWYSADADADDRSAPLVPDHVIEACNEWVGTGAHVTLWTNAKVPDGTDKWFEVESLKSVIKRLPEKFADILEQPASAVSMWIKIDLYKLLISFFSSSIVVDADVSPVPILVTSPYLKDSIAKWGCFFGARFGACNEFENGLVYLHHKHENASLFLQTIALQVESYARRADDHGFVWEAMKVAMAVIACNTIDQTYLVLGRSVMKAPLLRSVEIFCEAVLKTASQPVDHLEQAVKVITPPSEGQTFVELIPDTGPVGTFRKVKLSTKVLTLCTVFDLKLPILDSVFIPETGGADRWKSVDDDRADAPE